MTEQILRQKQSKILQRLLEALAPDFNKLQDKVNAVFDQGRREGLDDMKIGELVRQSMKEHYSQSTIQRVLPKSARHSEKVREPNSAVILTANEREPIIADNVSVTPTEEEHNFKKGVGVAITDEDDTQDDNPQNEKVDEPMSEALGAQVTNVTIADIHKENSELRQENKFLKDGLKYFKNENASLRKKVNEYDTLVDELQKELAKAELANEDLSKQIQEYQKLSVGNPTTSLAPA